MSSPAPSTPFNSPVQSPLLSALGDPEAIEPLIFSDTESEGAVFRSHGKHTSASAAVDTNLEGSTDDAFQSHPVYTLFTPDLPSNQEQNSRRLESPNMPIRNYRGAHSNHRSPASPLDNRSTRIGINLPRVVRTVSGSMYLTAQKNKVLPHSHTHQGATSNENTPPPNVLQSLLDLDSPTGVSSLIFWDVFGECQDCRTFMAIRYFKEHKCEGTIFRLCVNNRAPRTLLVAHPYIRTSTRILIELCSSTGVPSELFRVTFKECIGCHKIMLKEHYSEHNVCDLTD